MIGANEFSLGTGGFFVRVEMGMKARCRGW